MLRAWIMVAALAAPWPATAADPSGIITILEGEALIYRGTGRVHAAEGVRLLSGDIVETGASTFAQVELPDQSVAEFGPTTRVMLSAGTTKGKSERWLYVMDGWTKLTGSKHDPAAGPGYDVRMPLLEMPASQAVIVMRTSPAEASLFVERGEIRLTERQAGASSGALTVKTGDFYRRKAGGRGTTAASTPQDFVAQMPRAFRDSLPMRAERFRDHPVQPREATEFGYADVEAWLKAEPSVRRPLMQRWRVKAREPAFRQSLIANLSAHPEWDPILFPEKYKPKEPPPVRAALNAGRPASAASSVAP
jgi:hypothetical protein